MTQAEIMKKMKLKPKDAVKYAKREYWTAEEAILLTLNLNPEKVDWDKLKLNKKFMQDYHQRMEQLHEGMEKGELEYKEIPKENKNEPQD